jgi:hypothetical protein
LRGGAQDHLSFFESGEIKIVADTPFVLEPDSVAFLLREVVVKDTYLRQCCNDGIRTEITMTSYVCHTARARWIGVVVGVVSSMQEIHVRQSRSHALNALSHEPMNLDANFRQNAGAP